MGRMFLLLAAGLLLAAATILLKMDFGPPKHCATYYQSTCTSWEKP